MGTARNRYQLPEAAAARDPPLLRAAALRLRSRFRIVTVRTGLLTRGSVRCCCAIAFSKPFRLMSWHWGRRIMLEHVRVVMLAATGEDRQECPPWQVRDLPYGLPLASLRLNSADRLRGTLSDCHRSREMLREHYNLPYMVCVVRYLPASRLHHRVRFAADGDRTRQVGIRKRLQRRENAAPAVIP